MAALEDGLRSLTSDKLEKEFIPPLLKPLEHVFSFFSVLRYVGNLEGNMKLWDTDKYTSTDEAWWVCWFHFHSCGLLPSLPYYPLGKKIQ